MSRYAKDRRSTGPKPVERVELSEKHLGLRFLAMGVLLVIGVAAITFAVKELVTTPAGWAEVKVDSTADMNCGDDFQVLYNYGASGNDPSTEKRAFSVLYSAAAVKAYRLFSVETLYDGVCNLCYINAHVGEEIEVDPWLYTAFGTLAEAGDRGLFLGPLYSEYEALLGADEQWAAEYDPRLSEEVATWHKTVAGFAADADAVSLELLGDNRVLLHVSSDYAAFAKSYGITRFIDFGWMKNGFIADYLAYVFLESGYENAMIQSVDGFGRTLCAVPSELELYKRDGSTIENVAAVQYAVPMATAALRDYWLTDAAAAGYREYENGEIRTPYLDVADGFSREAAHELQTMSSSCGCAALLMAMKPVYIADTLDPVGMTGEGITWFYTEGNLLRRIGENADLTVTLQPGYTVL